MIPPELAPDAGDSPSDLLDSTIPVLTDPRPPSEDRTHLPGDSSMTSSALSPLKLVLTKTFPDSPAHHTEISADDYRRLSRYAETCGPVTALNQAMQSLLAEYLNVCRIPSVVSPLASVLESADENYDVDFLTRFVASLSGPGGCVSALRILRTHRLQKNLGYSDERVGGIAAPDPPIPSRGANVRPTPSEAPSADTLSDARKRPWAELHGRCVHSRVRL